MIDLLLHFEKDPPLVLQCWLLQNSGCSPSYSSATCKLHHRDSQRLAIRVKHSWAAGLCCRLPSSYRVTAVGSLYTLAFRILITSRDQEITVFRNVTWKSDLPALKFFRLVSAVQVEQFAFLQVPMWSLHFFPSTFGILLLGYTKKKSGLMRLFLFWQHTHRWKR